MHNTKAREEKIDNINSRKNCFESDYISEISVNVVSSTVTSPR